MPDIISGIGAFFIAVQDERQAILLYRYPNKTDSHTHFGQNAF